MALFLYRKIKKFAITQENVSTSMLQRKFNIGYAKAVKMLDKLEADGILKQKNGKGCTITSPSVEECNSAEELSAAAAIASANLIGAEFSEENVLKLLEIKGMLSSSLVQRTFSVGYGRAASMIDNLANMGYIIHDGERWVKK